ncbi:ATP-binding protein [Candidatus Parcubacteria bacterium]|nr:ATP-binding protein [Candidatus Parcubacteria bacterium]
MYAIDTGLANIIGFKFNENRGKLYENIVFIELERKKTGNVNLKTYYWKNAKHREVDFIIKEKNRIKQLIQVCYDLSDYKTKEREIKSLIKASDELKYGNLLIITDDFAGKEKAKNKKIKFIPLWKWLPE